MNYCLKRFVGVLMLLGVVGNFVFSQPEVQEARVPKAYFGLGMGLDYGGFGAKAEFLPIKHVGLFAGVGYNLLSVGWNAGLTYKILPRKIVSPNLMAFYGYNAVLKIDGAPEYNITSYRISFGVNLDIKLRRNKLSLGLFYPIRSEKFKERYNAAKNNPGIVFKNELFPITWGIGFNFGF